MWAGPPGIISPAGAYVTRPPGGVAPCTDGPAPQEYYLPQGAPPLVDGPRPLAILIFPSGPKGTRLRPISFRCNTQVTHKVFLIFS